MKVELKTTTNTTEETFTIRMDDGTVYHYTEWLNEKGKVIDCSLRDKDGYEVYDPELCMQIEILVDNYDV